jgi:hypothetical protein
MLMRGACAGKSATGNILHSSADEAVDEPVDKLGMAMYKLWVCAIKMQNGSRFL